jgi:hypothetical protein
MRDGEVEKLKIEKGGSARLSSDESEATLECGMSFVHPCDTTPML